MTRPLWLVLRMRATRLRSSSPAPIWKLGITKAEGDTARRPAPFSFHPISGLWGIVPSILQGARTIATIRNRMLHAAFFVFSASDATELCTTNTCPMICANVISFFP